MAAVATANAAMQKCVDLLFLLLLNYWQFTKIFRNFLKIFGNGNVANLSGNFQNLGHP